MPRKSVFIVASIVVVAVILSVCVVLVVSYSQQPLPTLSIDRVGNVTEVGQTVLVNVTLSNVPNATGCTGWRLSLAWNPYVAKITTFHDYSIGVPENVFAVVFEGPYLKQTGKGTVFFISTDPYALEENLEGKIDIFGFISSGGGSVSGTGVILSLNFTVVHVGTTTIEFRSPIQSSNQSLVLDGVGHPLEHVEIEGLITEKGIAEPPSFLTLILSEIAVLLTVTMLTVIVVRRRSTGKQL
jgi:hypothetical protein